MNKIWHTNINELKAGDRIGLFPGSFDPLHNGHCDLINCALQYNLSHIYLYPIFGFGKKFHSPLKKRNLQIREKIKTDRVHLVDLNLTSEEEYSVECFDCAQRQINDWFHDLKRKEVSIIQILGSDCMTSQPDEKFDGYLIFTRDSDPINPVTLEGYHKAGKWIQIHPLKNSISSTIIRKLIEKRTDITSYTNKNIQENL